MYTLLWIILVFIAVCAVFNDCHDLPDNRAVHEYNEEVVKQRRK